MNRNEHKHQRGLAEWAALLLGAAIAVGAAKVTAPDLMLHEQVSPYDFERTLQTITDHAKTRGWKVPKVYDFQETIRKEGGGDIGKVRVIELCQPKYAGELLKSDEHKVMSVMMPCAIGIYEKSDGKTYVATLNMKLMSKVFGGPVGEMLAQVAEDDAAMLSFLRQDGR